MSRSVPPDEVARPLSVWNLDLEWQFRQLVLYEQDGSLLVVLGIPLEHPKAGEVVDGGVLVVAVLLVGLPERFDELHIDLQGMPWALFLVTAPRPHRDPTETPQLFEIE